MYPYPGLFACRIAERNNRRSYLLNAFRSVRAICPHCKIAALTGQINTIKNIKLDNGDPDFRQYTVCSNCDTIVYVINEGLQLEPGVYNVTN